MLLRVPHSHQRTDYTCGPQSLRMVLEYFGEKIPLRRLIELAGSTPKTGTSHKKMREAMKALGLAVHTKHNARLREIESWISRGVPVVINYREWDDIGHYAVVVGIDKRHIYLHDPEHGPGQKISRAEFLKRWYGKHHSVNRRWYLAAKPKTQN